MAVDVLGDPNRRVAHLLGDYFDGHLHGDQERRARVAQFVDRPVTETRFDADLRHGLAEIFGIEGRPDAGGEDQLVVIVPELAAHQLLGFLARPVALEDFD